MIRVLVTGGTGFVGTQVVSTLLARTERKFEVIVLSRSQSASSLEAWQSGLSNLVSVLPCDIEDESSASAVVEQCQPDLVIHLAGVYAWWQPDASRFERVNIDGVRHLLHALQASPKKPKLVHVSTVLAFGNPAGRGATPDTAFDELTPAGPAASIYASSKHAGDEMVQSVFEAGSLVGCTCFLACCIGRDPKLLDPEHDVMKMKALVEGKVPAVIAGETTFTYVDVRDAAEAIVKAGEKLLHPVDVATVSGEKFLIGNQRLKTDAFYELIAELSGVPRPTWQVPAWLALGAGHTSGFFARIVTGRNPTAPADLVRTAAKGTLLFDATKSEQELGMSYRNIREAFAEAVAFIKESSSRL